MALASGAELLLLDEPTASMDPRSRDAFFRLVERLPAATTVLLCSHRLDEIRRLVDRVVLLEEGRVAWHGPAGAYLEAHAEALVEISIGIDAEIGAARGKTAAWLEERGFRRGAAGWWSKAMPVTERARLLAEIGQRLDGEVRDVIARDVERLTLRDPEKRSDPEERS
jgi:ABC-type multidrug transport system ATPase subunit